MERDNGTVAQLLRAMPIGDGGVTGYKVWIIFHQSGMAGSRETDRWMQQVWRCSDGYQGQEMVAGPAVGTKMLADLKWLWPSQGVSDSVCTPCHTLYVRKQLLSWSKAQCLTAAHFLLCGCGKTVEVLLRGSSRRIYGRAERCDEPPFSQVTPI